MARPSRFEPQQITDVRGAGDVHSRQLVERARAEGLLLARAEIDAAVAEHTAAARALSRAAEALMAAVTQLMTRDREDLADIEEQAIRFGFEVAEQLVGRELHSSDDAFAAAITRAMSLAPDRGPVVLRVNPHDVAGAGQAVELAPHVELVADATVEVGGCIAVVGALRIDAQIGPAMARVRGVVTGDPSV
jgi:flagellar assembly protein FliH